jgi:hypothetical protein
VKDDDGNHGRNEVPGIDAAEFSGFDACREKLCKPGENRTKILLHYALKLRRTAAPGAHHLPLHDAGV